MVNHILEGNVEGIQRIHLGQINIPIPDGDIPLRIHGAVIPQLHLPGLLPGADADGADRIVQTVLAQVLRRLDDKGDTELAEKLQQLLHPLLAHREGGVAVVNPPLLPVEGQRLGFVLPGKGLDRIAVQLQDNLPANLDLLLFLFGMEQTKGAEGLETTARAASSSKSRLDRFILFPPSFQHNKDPNPQVGQRENADQHQL